MGEEGVVSLASPVTTRVGEEVEVACTVDQQVTCSPPSFVRLFLIPVCPPVHSGLEAAGRPNQDFFYLLLEKYLCLFLFYKPSKLIQSKQS